MERTGWDGVFAAVGSRAFILAGYPKDGRRRGFRSTAALLCRRLGGSLFLGQVLW